MVISHRAQKLGGWSGKDQLAWHEFRPHDLSRISDKFLFNSFWLYHVCFTSRYYWNTICIEDKDSFSIDIFISTIYFVNYQKRNVKNKTPPKTTPTGCFLDSTCLEVIKKLKMKHSWHSRLHKMSTATMAESLSRIGTQSTSSRPQSNRVTPVSFYYPPGGAERYSTRYALLHLSTKLVSCPGLF